jgi:hypothetical protein
MLKEKVKEHGQQTFYAIKDNDDGTVVDLFEQSHRFKFVTVMDEFARHADTTNVDFEAFDQHELEDV